MLLQHAKMPGKIRLFFLLKEDVSIRQIDTMRNLADTWHCHSVQVIHPETLSLFSFQTNNGNNMLKTASQANFYRLFLPLLLERENRCLYLDGDLAVCADLQDLYETNLQEYYVAGVTDCLCHNDDHFSHVTGHDIPFGYYINAGVMLMNLEKMRNDHLLERFLRLNDASYFPFLDQDIINYGCRGNVKLLDKKFNVYPGDTPEVLSALRQRIPGQARLFSDTALTNPSIIHFVGSQKPWNDPSMPYADVWRGGSL